MSHHLAPMTAVLPARLLGTVVASAVLAISLAGPVDADAKRIVRGAKVDRVEGTQRSDVIKLGAGNDRASGRAGSDRIYGQRGNDRLYGNSGNDRLYGSTGRDRLSGGSGRDDLRGAGGRDTIIGGSGNDRLSGGTGNDVIRADDGAADRLVHGGPGRDVCYVDAADRKVRGCEQVIGRPTAPISTPRPVVPAPPTSSPVSLTSPATPTAPAASTPLITLPGGISIPLPQLPLPENGRIEITGAAFSGCTRVPVLNIPLVCNLGVTGVKGDGAVAVLPNATSLDLNASLALGTPDAAGNWSAVGTQISVLNLLTCPAGQSKELVAVSVGVDGAPVETSLPFSVACPV